LVLFCAHQGLPVDVQADAKAAAATSVHVLAITFMLIPH